MNANIFIMVTFFSYILDYHIHAVAHVKIINNHQVKENLICY